jgi:hypothetical protein
VNSKVGRTARLVRKENFLGYRWMSILIEELMAQMHAPPEQMQ